jgi:hypothetical protein
MERVRRPRAGLVTPFPGGSGHRPAGTMTGLRGASLDWDRLTAANARQGRVPGSTAGAERRRLFANARAAAERRQMNALRFQRVPHPMMRIVPAYASAGVSLPSLALNEKEKAKSEGRKKKFVFRQRREELSMPQRPAV